MVLGSSDGAAAGIDPSEEMEVEGTSETVSERVVVDEDKYRPPTVVSQKSKECKHIAISEDPWLSGSKQLSQKDHIFERNEVVRRIEKKSRLRKCILRGISDMVTKEIAIDVGSELGCVNRWINHTRSRTNNVNLK